MEETLLYQNPRKALPTPAHPIHVPQPMFTKKPHSYSSAHLQPFSESLFQDKKGPVMGMVTDVKEDKALSW